MTETQLTENSALTFENILKLFKEIAERSKETDERLDKQIKETDVRFKEVAEDFKEVAEDLKKTERIVKETSRSVGALDNKWGEFVEGIVAPAAVRLFRERGFEVNRIQKRVNVRESGRGIEIDILVMNGDCIILIEAKSTLKKKNIDDHLKRLVDFRYFFPEHKEKKLLGAVAGIIVHSGIEEYAYKKGLFVLAQKGDDVQILNDEKFKASEW